MIAALAAALLAQGATGELVFTTPAGFSVDRPSGLAGSLLALAFAPDGSVFVGRESESIARLVDRDGDGRFEEDPGAIQAGLVAVQGLLALPGRIDPDSASSESTFSALLAIGTLPGGATGGQTGGQTGGECGVWRIPLVSGRQSGAAERLFAFTAGGEHGPHALLAGPDGAIYAVVGNQSAFRDASRELDGFWRGDEGRLLAPLSDPLGFGRDVRYPGGFVARLDLARRSWRFVVVGLRNAYDAAFDASGFPWAVDSDMEWDLGLPWYRPVRLCALVEGGDFGSRAGSGVIPAWCPDTTPARLELPRGSPTGAVFGTRAKFPAPWREVLFSGDWAVGKILAIRPGNPSRGAEPACETFLSASGPLPVTDVDVAPDGSLWFVTGGRGARGGVFRVVHREAATIERANPPAPSTTFVAPETARLAAAVRALTPRGAIPEREFALGRLVAGAAEEYAAALRLVAAALPSVAAAPPSVAAETGGEDLETLARSARFEERLGALFLFAPPERLPGRADRASSLALELLAEVDRARAGRPGDELAILRGVELALLRQGLPRPELAASLAERLLARFPGKDERANEELALLLAHLDEPRALAPILERLESSPQAAAIHYADCARRMTRGFDDEARARLLRWFARSSAYTGGASLPGYLSAMRASFVGSLSAASCAALVGDGELDAESQALLLARLPTEVARERFPAFEAALARLVPRAFGTREQADKDAALLAVGAVSLPEVEELARRLARAEGDVLEAPWTLLARTPRETDFELWLRAIVSPSIAKRERALEALSRLATRPATASAWRSLLDHLPELGPRRGRELSRLVARWTAPVGEAPAPDVSPGPNTSGESADPQAFERARLDAERWYALAFPDGEPPLDVDAAPRRTEADLATFLARTAARSGSPDVGRAVFESAGCSACHAVGAAPATDRYGIGPDLAGVSERLADAEVLAAILAPSRVVSEQYQASIAITRDERLFEGFVLRRDEQGTLLKPFTGEPIQIDADELESLAPSPRSPMPEGLLDGRTLEELRDLFAYLKAGRGDASRGGWSPLFGAGGIAGWDGDGAVWSLRGRTLVGRSQGLERSSYALAPLPAADLIVEFDVLLPPGANSGLCYRAARRDPLATGSADPTGAQADLGQSYWGSLYVDGRGTVAQPESAALEAVLARRGWNHVRVSFVGDRHAMEINGLPTYDVELPGIDGPAFGFQVHQGKPMVVRVANARWRRP